MSFWESKGNTVKKKEIDKLFKVGSGMFCRQGRRRGVNFGSKLIEVRGYSLFYDEWFSLQTFVESRKE